MPSAPLPVFDLAAKSFGDVFGDLKGFFRVTAIILGLVLACMVIPALFALLMGSPVPPPDVPADSTNAASHAAEQIKAMQAARHGGGGIGGGLIALLAGLFQMLVMACYTRGWYRQQLLGENKGATIQFQVGKGEWTIILTMLKFAGIVILPVIGIMIVGGILAGILGATMGKGGGAIGMVPAMIVAFGGMLYASARFVLIMPLAALDEPAPLRKSWDMTKGSVWRILAALVLIGLGFNIPFMIAVMIFTFIGVLILPAFLATILIVAIEAAAAVMMAAIAMGYASRALAFLKQGTV